MKRLVMGGEVVIAVTKGVLDIDPWEQIFYGGIRWASKKTGAGEEHR